MATHRISIMGANTVPDSSGKVFMDIIENQATIGTGTLNQLCMVMQPTAAGGDVGFSGSFSIPKNYVGSPKIIVKGILDGTPADILAFGFAMIGIADAEAVDAAYEAADLVNKSSWVGYTDEDLLELTITLTVTIAVDDQVFYNFFRDDSVEDTTQNFLLTSLEFQYSDA